jgi:hypothetical protein
MARFSSEGGVVGEVRQEEGRRTKRLGTGAETSPAVRMMRMRRANVC